MSTRPSHDEPSVSRLLAAARRPNCPKVVIDQLKAIICRERRELSDCQRNVALLEAWVKFHDDPHLTQYERQYRLFRIDDGETHIVAATERAMAVEFYAVKLCGYKSIDSYRQDVGRFDVQELDPGVAFAVHDVDETGIIVVKTHAEWADVDQPELISTTAY